MDLYDLNPHLTHSFDLHESAVPNGISISSAVFAQIIHVPKLPTCHPLWLQMDSSFLTPSNTGFIVPM